MNWKVIRNSAGWGIAGRRIGFLLPRLCRATRKQGSANSQAPAIFFWESPEIKMQAGSPLINLAISADEFVRFFKERVTDVVARASNGQAVRFPANILRPYVLRDGVQRRFRRSFDGAGNLLTIESV